MLWKTAIESKSRKLQEVPVFKLLIASCAGGGGAFSSAAGVGFGSAAGGGGGVDGTPASMQLVHFLSTHPSISCSPDPPKCLPPHSLAMIPAITPNIVMTASTTTSVSIDWCVECLGSTTTATGGASTSGGSSFSTLIITTIFLPTITIKTQVPNGNEIYASKTLRKWLKKRERGKKVADEEHRRLMILFRQ
ncbi:hypothetical protein M9H77_04126 [Catharanthus roseus]|uniref:Uncharacterized protein n=1 Tax=Catharanthus roseus TaxID=4058 RepID=A0ACC0CD44_CATRO|nr:hypothetical protein M9H77_04126 [Catharanthus roseus]